MWLMNERTETGMEYLFKTVENIFIMWRMSNSENVGMPFSKLQRSIYEGVDREKDHQLDDMPR